MDKVVNITLLYTLLLYLNIRNLCKYDFLVCQINLLLLLFVIIVTESIYLRFSRLSHSYPM